MLKVSYLVWSGEGIDRIICHVVISISQVLQTIAQNSFTEAYLYNVA